MSGVGGLRSWGWAVRLPYTPTNHHLRRRIRRSIHSTSCTAEKKGKKEKVLVISGPTGAGKSRLALELAKRLNGEIISADSVQRKHPWTRRVPYLHVSTWELNCSDTITYKVYRGLDVGSAKPSPSDRKEVPHHLLDILHPSEDYSAGQFYEDARQATKEVLKNGHVPIVTGGTGLYLRWFVSRTANYTCDKEFGVFMFPSLGAETYNKLLSALTMHVGLFIYGKPDVPKASRESTSQVYAELENYERNGDWDSAVQLVVEAGDLRAPSFPTNNWYRLRRSLEIIKSSGSPPSAFQLPYESFKEQLDSDVPDDSHNIDGTEGSRSRDLEYDFICFFLSSPRLHLYRSIDLRCEDMVSGADGILAEAKWLLDLGLHPNSNSATRAIGYRQGMEYLLRCREEGGQSSANDFFSFLWEFQKASRNFAKRQMTWFRNEPIYHWLDASKPLEKVLNFIHDTYHDQSGLVTVPESLRMKKDVSSHRESAELKAYRTKNRYFVTREDCADVLSWIRAAHLEEVSA